MIFQRSRTFSANVHGRISKFGFSGRGVMARMRASIAPQNVFPSKTLTHHTYTAPVFRRKTTEYGTTLTYSFIHRPRSSAHGHSIHRPRSLCPLLFLLMSVQLVQYKCNLVGIKQITRTQLKKHDPDNPRVV